MVTTNEITQNDKREQRKGTEGVLVSYNKLIKNIFIYYEE